MPDYRVEWSMDITAESPEHAARLAKEYICAPDSWANVFEVYDTTDRATNDYKVVTIDLTAIDEVLASGSDSAS